MIFFDQLFQNFFGFFYFVLWLCRENNRCIQYLSGLIHNSQLTAGTECRVPAQHNSACDRRLHQKLLQIFTKDSDRTVLRLLCQLISDLTLDRRCDQSCICICNNLCQNRCCHRIIRCNDLFFQITQDTVCRCFYLYDQHLFLLATVECQNTMTDHFFDWLLIGIIIFVYALFFFILGSADNLSFFKGQITDVNTVIRFIGYLLRNDIFGAIDRFFGVCNAFFRIHVSLCCLCQRCGRILLQNIRCKRLQTLFLCNGSSGFTLLFIRAVQIFQYYKRFCRFNPCFQFFRQLALFLDTAQNTLLFILQIAEVSKTLIEITQYLVI